MPVAVGQIWNPGLESRRTILVQEDATSVVMLQLYNYLGTRALRADFTSIAWSIQDSVTGNRDDRGTLTIADVVSDTFVTNNARWTLDTVGYNFVHVVPANAFPVGDRLYVLVYTFTETSGAVYTTEFNVYSRPVILT